MFYKDILKYFNDLKTLYCYEKGQNMVIFNNKEILVGVNGLTVIFCHPGFTEQQRSVSDLPRI